MINYRKVFIDEIKMIPKCSEIGILFGGYEMIPNRADVAVKLYKKRENKNNNCIRMSWLFKP